MYVLLSSGDLYSWGYNSLGQVGNGTTTSNVPIPYRVLLGVTDIIGDVQGWPQYSYNSTSPLAKTSSGYYNWGYGINGQIGNGSTVTISSPQKVILPLGTNIKLFGGLGTISNGWSRYAITTDNKIYAWGYNNYRSIDNYGTDGFPVPVMYIPNKLQRWL
jgi:alpha-tubulin suppressor-like RCC1 family protein